MRKLFEAYIRVRAYDPILLSDFLRDSMHNLGDKMRLDQVIGITSEFEEIEDGEESKQP